MANSNMFLSPCESSDSSRKNVSENFLILSWILCYVYSLESPHQGDSNEYTQHTIIVEKIKKKYRKLSIFASRPGTMINPQWLELPMSRTIFCGPRDVRAT